MSTSPRARILEEFAEVDLGDRRRNRRAVAISERLLAEPGQKSLARAMKTPAEAQALERFLSNENVSLEALLEPHTRNTKSQLKSQPLSLIIHDSSECFFPGAPPDNDLGYLGKRPGFLLHLALAVTADEEHTPLGTAGAMVISRPQPQVGTKAARQAYRTSHPSCARESKRWGHLIARTDDGTVASIIHVMDREGDIYQLLSDMTAKKQRFVVRLRKDRLLLGEYSRISDAMVQSPFLGERKVNLCKRSEKRLPRAKEAFPSRAQRMAQLQVRAQRVQVKRPQKVDKRVPDGLEVTVVEVIEPDPPEGETPISWTLLTSESAGTREEAFAVVDHYRGRWRIEEFFKALKTGCGFTKRQVHSLEAAMNEIGLMIPIAWQMIALRSLAHSEPDAPADSILRPSQIAILVGLKRVPPNPTAYAALIAIAEWGGYRKKRNCPPGWFRLARGFETLDSYEVGWTLASLKK